MRTNKRTKVRRLAYIVFASIAFAFLMYATVFNVLYITNQFFEQNRLNFKPVVEFSIKFNAPITVEKKGKVKTMIKPAIFPRVAEVQAQETLLSPEPTHPSDAEIIRYIKSKDWDDGIAVRIAKSENNWNLTKSFDCTRIGPQNSNGTRDYGLFQINDIHIRANKITKEDALDCYKATDFAYKLYKDWGDSYRAWSAYNNGSYLNYTAD